MIDKIVLPNILFLDIETVPQLEFFTDLPEEAQQLFADKTQYQRKDDVTPEEFYNRAGIWAEFGKIICISVGYFTIKNAERQFRTKSIIGEEKQLLEEFNDLVKTHFSNPAFVFCGHNIKEFDIPYMCRRMLINGINIPEKLQLFGRKPWEIPHLDTLELWKFGDYKHYTSLKLLTHVLNIPSPKEDIDGSEVRNVYYNEKNIDRIAKYCERDVVAVAQIFLRMRNEPILNIPSPKEDIDGSEVRNVYYNEKDIDRIAKYCERDVVAVAQIFLRMRNEPILKESEIFSV